MHIQPYHIQNPGWLRTQDTFKILSNMYNDNIDSEPCHSQNILFKHFQRYLGILRDLYTYSATLTDVQLGGKVDASPAFFKKRKNCPDFWKEDLDCVHLWVKFSIQNVVLRVSRRKNSKMFPWRASFSGVFEEIFIEEP